ncbi:hypothetical protein D3C87_1697980 [compost metagenome]
MNGRLFAVVEPFVEIFFVAKNKVEYRFSIDVRMDWCRLVVVDNVAVFIERNKTA